MLVKRAVITAGGLGTRLLPMSKELPKEMMAVFLKSSNGIVVKPILQALFEQLYNFGLKDFCFIVGRGKRAIEDHFTPDWRYVRLLVEKGKNSLASELQSFYNMVEGSRIVWVNQPEPKGFGHAVLMAESFVRDEPFLVAAGDTYIISNSFIHKMVKMFLTRRPLAVLLLQKHSNPRQYGVAVVNNGRVLEVVEKPENPPSNLAIMPIYVFDPIILEKLSDLKASINGEIQLTDAIQRLIDVGRVEAIILNHDEPRLDIGTPETYWEAIKASYEWSSKDGIEH